MRDLLLRLFNLHGVDLGGPRGWTLRFLSEWQPPVLVFGGLALVVLVWQVYRREKGTASPRWKAMLAFLRMLALAALVFVLLRPAVIVRRSELKRAYVLFLADKSDSMKLADQYRDDELLARLAYATGLTETLDPSRPVDPDLAHRIRSMSRAEIANRVLANPRFNLVAEIARTCRVRQFVFASHLEPAPGGGRSKTTPPAGARPPAPRPLRIIPDGPTTQIGECIRDAIAELRGQRIAAMVVLSDWYSNSGISPEDATRYALSARSPFPILTVGVGDPREQRDIAVVSVAANSVAFLHDPLVFHVAVEQSGYDGETVPLELRLGGEVMATKKITLGRGRTYYTLSHRPTKKGTFEYVVSVPKRADELSGRNNSARHTVTVKDDKIRVLLVAGLPSWEWRYLKAALVRDKTVEAGIWLQSADPRWVMPGGRQLTEMPLNKKELVDRYDVVFFLGASADALSEESLEDLRAFVGDFGGGLIFCAGSLVLNEAFAKTPLAKCLPVHLEPPEGYTPSDATRQPFRPRITAEGWAHPAMKLVEDAHRNRRLWARLAGMFWFHPVSRVKPGARVLAVHPTERTERGPLPLFVEQRYGAGRVFFCATDDTWRWRFLVGDKYFYRFWRQVIGLSASSKLLGSAKRLSLSLARTQYTVGQKVEIEAKVLDEMLRPSGEKHVWVTIDLPGGSTRKLRLNLVDPTQGIYRGAFVARRVGRYAAWMRLGPTEKPETVPFTVSMSTLESESRRLNVETMKAVARKTSGEHTKNWFMIHEIDRIPERIRSEAENIVTEHATEIWDSWGCLLLFVVPLASEWWLRKRRLLT